MTLENCKRLHAYYLEAGMEKEAKEMAERVEKKSGKVEPVKKKGLFKK